LKPGEFPWVFTFEAFPLAHSPSACLWPLPERRVLHLKVDLKAEVDPVDPAIPTI
jgi:hypothetical protein